MCEIAKQTFDAITSMNCEDRVCHSITIYPESVTIVIVTTILAIYYPLGHILMIRRNTSQTSSHQIEWKYTLNCTEKDTNNSIKDYHFVYNDAKILQCLMPNYQKKSDALIKYYNLSNIEQPRESQNGFSISFTNMIFIMEIIKLIFFGILMGILIWSICVITPTYMKYLRFFIKH